jgi:hypothetical protein
MRSRRAAREAENVTFRCSACRENDWILSAAHGDPTLMRDALGYATARRLGRWTPRTRFVELYLQRRYQGVYLLTEQLKLDPGRVAVAREGISGGYLLEASTDRFDGGFASLWPGQFYGHKDPSRKQLDDDEAAWIADYVQGAQRAVAARDGSWRTVVDEAAAVDYLLLQELFKNYDAFSRSVFLTKGSDRRLELGPVWDLDRSMGSIWPAAPSACTAGSRRGAPGLPTCWPIARSRAGSPRAGRSCAATTCWATRCAGWTPPAPICGPIGCAMREAGRPRDGRRPWRRRGGYGPG